MTDPVLRGFTVGITADRRWEEQAALFERRAATVVHAPAIQTLALGDDEPLRLATEAVLANPPNVLIANTGIGVRAWLAAAEAWGLGTDLIDTLATCSIYSRGPKASGAVHSAGLEVAGRAKSERLSEAVDMALHDLPPGSRVALQVDGRGDLPPEVARLEKHGVEVVPIPVYRWKMPPDARPAVRLAGAVIAGRVHAITFTAAPAVHNWMAIAAEHDLDHELRTALTDGRTVVGCVGPVCAEAAVAEGLGSEHLVYPAVGRLGPMVRAVTERLVSRQISLAVGDTRIVLAGNCLTVDDEPLHLSDTEARLFAALAARPNVVLTKEQLLEAVWGDSSGDPHAVETTVARLRRRLGAHGSCVQSVARRGYALRP